MSLNIVPVKPLEVMDRRVRVNNERCYGVLKGGQELSYQQFPSTSFTNSQVQFTCNPPSPETIINRKVYVQMNFFLQFTGTADTGATLINVANGITGSVPAGSATGPQSNASDAPRAYPIAAILNTLQATINNDQVSTNLNQYWQALLRYHNFKTKIEEYSITPSMLDQFQNYSDAGAVATRNVLGSYIDASSMADDPRGSFSGLQVLSNQFATSPGGPASATVQLLVTEPIWLSPFIFGHGDESGFVGVQNMSFTMTLGNLQRVWSHALNTTNSGIITNLSVGLSGASMLFNYITPNLLEPIPKAISYPYYEITPYPTLFSSALAPNASVVQTMQAIQLKAIPRRMYIFAREQDSVLQGPLGYTRSDVFAYISNLNITWNNRTGLLSTATPQDLYEMSVKNGLDISWDQYSRFVGSPVCVEFGTDIGLSGIEAPGLLGNYQLSMQVTCTNTNQSESINYTLYVVVVNEGSFSVVNGSCLHQVGVLSQQDILNSESGPSMVYNNSHEVYGGDFFGKIGDFFKRAYSKLKEIQPSKYLGLIPHPYAQGPASVLRSVGLGRRKKAGRPKKGRKRGGASMLEYGLEYAAPRNQGGELLGGKMISRKALKRRLGGGLQNSDEETNENQKVEVEEQEQVSDNDIHEEDLSSGDEDEQNSD